MKSIIKKRTFRSVVLLINILFCGICIQSCDKDDFDLSDNSNESPQSFNTNVNFSPNVTNPYDFIGKYHNDGLQFVIDKYKKSPKLKSEQELNEQIKDLVISYMKEYDTFTSSNIKTSLNSSGFDIIDKINLNQIRLKNENLFSIKKQQIYYEKLMNVFNNNISSPQILINYFNEIEDNIIKDEKLTEEEKSQLLITSAVAKYSSIFWIEVLLENDNRGKGVRLKDGSESNWNFSDWWQNTFMPKAEEVVKADFGGAASGAIMGALVGGVGGTIAAPGPGTITVGISGAMVGGAQGAIGSSALWGIYVIFW